MIRDEQLQVSACPVAYEKSYIPLENSTTRWQRCTSGGLRKWIAWTCLAVVIFGMFGFVILTFSLKSHSNSTKGQFQE